MTDKQLIAKLYTLLLIRRTQACAWEEMIIQAFPDGQTPPASVMNHMLLGLKVHENEDRLIEGKDIPQHVKEAITRPDGTVAVELTQTT